MSGIDMTPPLEQSAMVDVELPYPIKGFVKDEVLYGMDESKQGISPCTIFSFTSYKDRAPTLKILLEDGSLFSFVPFHMLFHKHPDHSQGIAHLEINDLCWRNCPDYAIALTSPRFLQGDVHCYFLQQDQWMDGIYLASLDWYLDNLIMHLVLLENSQFAILPSHKVKFQKGDKSFKQYRKITKSWEIAPKQGHIY